LVEMYCPIVAIFPSLCRLVLGDDFIVIGWKSGVNVQVGKLIGIGECAFKGVVWDC